MTRPTFRSYYRIPGTTIVLRMRTELNGEIVSTAPAAISYEDMKLTGEASGEPLQGKTMTFAAQGQLLVDKAANVAEWTGLKISANQLRALGELKVNDLDKTPQISGGLSIAQFDLAKFVDSIRQKLPAMAEGSLSKVELASRVKGTPTSIALRDLNLKLDEGTFTGRIAVDDFARQSLLARAAQGRHLQRRPLPAAKIGRSQQRHASASGRSGQHRSRCHGRRGQHTAAGQAPTKDRVEHRAPAAG